MTTPHPTPYPTPHPTPGQPRIIKKYPNRRLYDTQTSAYVTLAQIKQLVIARQAIAVRDAKTDEDLTRSILLQIILEEEAGGAPLFTEAMLTHIICFYGHAMQGFLGNYMEKNLQMLADFQNRWAAHTAQTPAAWNAFMPGAYAQSAQKIQEQFQENLRKQSEQMLALFGMRPKN